MSSPRSSPRHDRLDPARHGSSRSRALPCHFNEIVSQSALPVGFLQWASSADGFMAGHASAFPGLSRTGRQTHGSASSAPRYRWRPRSLGRPPPSSGVRGAHPVPQGRPTPPFRRASWGVDPGACSLIRSRLGVSVGLSGESAACPHPSAARVPEGPFPPTPFPPVTKAPSIAAFVGDRSAAWVDDYITDEATEWASQRQAPTLLIPVDPAVGLELEHGAKLKAWQDALASGSFESENAGQ
jgi:hypothetical protein